MSLFDVCDADEAAAGAAAALAGLEAVAVVESNSLGQVVDCGPCILEGRSGRRQKADGVGRLEDLGRMEDGDLTVGSVVCLAIG